VKGGENKLTYIRDQIERLTYAYKVMKAKKQNITALYYKGRIDALRDIERKLITFKEGREL